MVHTLNLGSHCLIIGQVEETWVSEDCTSGGQPDVGKVKPIVFSVGEEKRYYGIGEPLAKAFSAGKELKK